MLGGRTEISGEFAGVTEADRHWQFRVKYKSIRAFVSSGRGLFIPEWIAGVTI